MLHEMVVRILWSDFQKVTNVSNRLVTINRQLCEQWK